MSKVNSNEKIDLNSLTKKLCVQDLMPFEAYLKDVWLDLYSRVNKNKNDPKEKAGKLKGLSKIIFNSYYTLPGIIGERLFNVFDTNSSDSIELDEFVYGMKTLFGADYEKNTKFIFDFYDFDNNGKINKEDIRVILSYITLTYSDSSTEKKTADKTNISFKNRVTSQEELNNILNICFNYKQIKDEKLEYKDFRYIIENINSDIYLMIFLFLLERKPFTNKNIQSYQHNSRNSSRKSSDSGKGKRKRLLASPTKTANFSPYRRFHRQSASINIQKQNTVNIHSEMVGIGDTQTDFSMSPVLKNSPRKKNSYNFTGQNVIHLQALGNEEKEVIYSGFKKSIQNGNKNENKNENKNDNKNDINEERINELTSRKKRENNIREDSPLKPAFKQSKKKKARKKEKDSDN